MTRRCITVGIAAVTFALSPAIGHATTADDVCPATASPCIVSTAINVDAGSPLDFGARALDVKSTGSVTVNGGLMTILAGSVQVESHGAILGAFANGTAASIMVMTSGPIQIQTGANGDSHVDVSTANPGEIDLIAHGDITIDGQLDADATKQAGRYFDDPDLRAPPAARSGRARAVSLVTLRLTSSRAPAASDGVPLLTPGSVRGTSTRNVEPSPGVLLAETVPPSASVSCFTMLSPSPTPPVPRVLLSPSW
jgi:hypothetical protein